MLNILLTIEHGANNTKAVGLRPVCVRVGLDDPSGSLPTPNILLFWDLRANQENFIPISNKSMYDWCHLSSTQNVKNDCES